MVVDTDKLAHTRFYEPQNIIERGKANKYATSPGKFATVYSAYLKAASSSSLGIKAKVDFIIADTAKGSFVVAEMKRSVGRVGARQIAPYLRKPVIAGDLYILPPETDVYHRRIFVHKGIEALPKLVKVARPIEIAYPNQALVETLLGSKGKHVLEKVFDLIRDAAELDWPLDKVEAHYVCDSEVEDWEYVLLLLVFNCDFDTADRHLHELYNQIDMISGELSDEEQEVLRRMIFFDIETKATVPSD